VSSRGLRIVDGAGSFGAIVAALCCAGTPIIVSALSAVGLGFLRRDAILWPIMLGSLLVALWGFWRGVQSHRNAGPIVLGIAGAVSLALGVIVVHGPPAMTMIYAGAVVLVLATIWNVLARRGAVPFRPVEEAR
jgi:mercuric ion transport protein